MKPTAAVKSLGKTAAELAVFYCRENGINVLLRNTIAGGLYSLYKRNSTKTADTGKLPYLRFYILKSKDVQ